jgi:hypothetical protein
VVLGRVVDLEGLHGGLRKRRRRWLSTAKDGFGCSLRRCYELGLLTGVLAAYLDIPVNALEDADRDIVVAAISELAELVEGPALAVGEVAHVVAGRGV